ncbi:tRNA glutamyl-Q(34) synthetase GluQRS [Edaphobacter albus]|uniref:tRNA glutamyl-Q(34) synthetase GluQRS n=1 Tax=Edaphobacter sp. 4G125 TaxID=2763071 RepID=UPI0016493A36|nr:tRNA glutamyl-Q(34) synthetase GluQRS [Edaphobacter sp. 4G125]QNI36852.1 tRNA glutamyl-Q(34) synthetase GluQRS [Edaphobacter sp. 4G125]
MSVERYIGRLAPSPTGLLHLGHAATFWTAYQRALQHNGTLLLRNEDLDPQRSRQEYVDAMIEDLAWLGIEWTLPMIVQSERIALYRAAFERLLASGHAYACTCSRRDLAQMTQAPHEETQADQPGNVDDEPVYNRKCRPATNSPAQSLQENTNYRFRVPDGEAITFIDRNLGSQSFIAGQDFGDFLIWRKDSLPSYQLSCVVDDAEMQITEVVRGADLLKSTARQILLQRALGLQTPAYFHAPLLRDEQGIRLAKRHHALAIRSLRQRGLSPAEVLKMIQV